MNCTTSAGGNPVILIVGAGGIGAPLGAVLHASGMDPVFLLTPRRAGEIAQKGLRVDWGEAQSVCQPRVIGRGDAPVAADMIILTCKLPDLPAVMADIALYVGPGSVILPLMNGMDHLDALAQRFPDAEVWGGLASLGAERRGETVNMLTTSNALTVGGLTKAPDAQAVSLLQRGFAGSPFRLNIHPDIRAAMFAKYIYICSLAGATAMTNADTGRILSAPFGEPLLAGLIDEGIAIAGAVGEAFDADMLAEFRRHVLDPAGHATSSMLRDLRSGLFERVEIALLSGMVERARRHGVAAPTLDLVVSSLSLRLTVSG